MTSKLTITREQATDKEIQMLIDSHENGTAMFLRVDAYYLMAKELQERRKADSEPVAWMHNNNNIGIPAITTSPKIGQYWMTEFKDVRPLYRHAQQPVVPDYFASLVAAARVRADKAIRKFPQPNYVLNKVAEESGEVIKAVIHYTEGREEWSNVEAEIIDNLAMLLRLVKEGDQVIGFTPPVSCRAAMLQAGNSPVIGIDPASGPDRTVEVRYVAPPGYVMVPKEPTDEMIAAAMNCDDVLFNSDESFCVQFGNIYEAMLAVAPTGIPMNSNAWIPVSERMPDCWCRTCRPVVLNDMRLVVCPDCGNKRCPRANDHRNACTGSNEPGQEGSAYPDTPQEVNNG